MSASAYDPERPWARQPNDSDLAWAVFSNYLALPAPRRLRDLLKTCPLSWPDLEILAANGWWRERAALWDDHLAEIRTKVIERVTEESAEEVARRQLALVRRMQKIADKELAVLEKVLDQANDFPGTLTPRDATRLAVEGMRLERLILGEATERTAAVTDVSGLTLDDLRQARALQAKAGLR